MYNTKDPTHEDHARQHSTQTTKIHDPSSNGLEKMPLAFERSIRKRRSIPSG